MNPFSRVLDDDAAAACDADDHDVNFTPAKNYP